MDLVKEWFSDHPITALNIITVSAIWAAPNIIPVENVGKMYKIVVDQLLSDEKIDHNRYIMLISEYTRLKKDNIVENFISVIYEISNNPNLMSPNKWTLTTNSTRIRNRCIPCKSKSNPN